MIDGSVVKLFYGLATLFGGVIGLSELVSRYRDAPMRAILTIPASAYITLNALASFGALLLIREMGWLDTGADDVKRLVTQSMVAGFGAMAFFRTSFFVVRVGNADVAIGPAGFLQVLLGAADRACDRSRAGPRARAIADIMRGISFDRSRQALPALCFQLMQNVSGEEQRAFSTVVKELEASQMSEDFKANNLGLALMNLVGENVLREAVGILRGGISAPPKPVVQSIATLQLLRNVNFEASADNILSSCLIISGSTADAKLQAELQAWLEKAATLGSTPSQRVLMLSALLINKFGEGILQTALRSLPENDGVNPRSGPARKDPAVAPVDPNTTEAEADPGAASPAAGLTNQGKTTVDPGASQNGDGAGAPTNVVAITTQGSQGDKPDKDTDPQPGSFAGNTG